MKCLEKPARCLAVACLSVAALACGETTNDDIDLNVPYVSQDNNFYCGPASVLMWRLFDRLPSVSQTEIANYMGTTDSCGTFSYRIADGVSHFTASGADAIWDADDYDNRDYFVARQITSIDTSIPVLVVAGSFHAGVIDGGHHHEVSGTGGMHQWDYVYFHDPQIGPDRYYEAAAWLDELCTTAGGACEQIISSSATGGWYSNYSEHSDDVIVGGGSGKPGGDPLPK